MPEPEPVTCPFCDSTIPAECVGPDRYWCGCCARLFQATGAVASSGGHTDPLSAARVDSSIRMTDGSMQTKRGLGG